MARSGWSVVRTKAETAAFDFYKEQLTIRTGSLTVQLQGVLDTSQDRMDRSVRSPDGTHPVLASLSCWRADLGFIPSVNEAIRISRNARPTEEQMYVVVSVNTTSDLLVIELQAHTNRTNPFA